MGDLGRPILEVFGSLGVILGDFATKELLPVLENKEVASATEIVIENYKQFRRSKDA